MALTEDAKNTIKSNAYGALKREHPDWDEQKLKMQAGRKASQDIAKAELEERKSSIRDQLRREDSTLEGTKLEKAVDDRIRDMDNQEKIKEKQAKKTKLLEEVDALTVEIADLRKGKKTDSVPKDELKKLDKIKSILA